MQLIGLLRCLLIFFQLLNPIALYRLEFIIHLLLMIAIFPENVTLDKIHAKDCLITLFLMEVLLLKISRPCYVLEILLI